MMRIRSLTVLSLTAVLAAGCGTLPGPAAPERGHDARLVARGIQLPPPPPPAANYLGTGVRTGHLLYMSGTASVGPGRLTGKVGDGISTEQAAQLARLSALGLVANVRKELGSLDRVRRIVRLTGYVNAASDFKDVAKVNDGASDLLVEIFGDAGRGARVTVGVAATPFQVPVYLEAIFEVD